MYCTSKNGKTGLLFALFCLLAPLGFSAVAQEAEPVEEELVDRFYRVKHMNVYDAFALATSQCATFSCKGELVMRQGRESVRVEGFEIRAGVSTHGKIRKILDKKDAPPPVATSHLFQIAILKAGLQETKLPVLSPGAARALEDLQQVFNFRGYELLAMPHVAANGLARVATRGADGISYKVDFSARPDSEGQIDIRGFGLARVLTDGEMETRENLISSSFSLKSGETVVVGASRLNGDDQALIVLFSALPQGQLAGAGKTR